MNILNLPSWAVLETRESDHDYHITVQLTYPPSHCPHCGVVANLQGYGGKEQLFLDLPIQMKRVAILVQRRRGCAARRGGRRPAAPPGILGHAAGGAVRRSRPGARGRGGRGSAGHSG